MIYFDFPVFLASASPRRKEILKNLISSFDIVTTRVDESNLAYLNPERLTKKNSLRKMLSAKKEIHAFRYLIIAADTVVSFQGRIFGKPSSRMEAINTLMFLSGKTHEVITGVTFGYIFQSKMICSTWTETTYVTFNTLSEKVIIAYVDDQKPFDKAGSYGIQELPKDFVKNIRGDYDNIVGLPAKSLYKMLKGLKD